MNFETMNLNFRTLSSGALAEQEGRGSGRLVEDRGKEPGHDANPASWTLWLRLKSRICLVWEASSLQGLQLLQPGEMALARNQ